MEIPRRVLITDDVHPHLIAALEAHDYECDYQPNTTDAQTRAAIAPYTGLIINSKINVDTTMLERAANLRWVGRLGSGLEIIDRLAATRHGVSVYSSPEGNAGAVGEHALGLLLGLANNLARADRQVRQFDWQREANRGWELRGKTIGVIGMGHTGSSLVRKLAGLEMQVLTYDKYLPKGYLATHRHIPPALHAIGFMKETTMQDIFDTADIVSLHLPLTTETRHLANAGWMAAFQKPFVLLNTSRGQVVDTAALIKNLGSGKILAAGLDVFENEKPTTFTDTERAMYSALYSFDNVLLTPHVAGWTRESKQLLAEVLAQKILHDFP